MTVKGCFITNFLLFSLPVCSIITGMKKTRIVATIGPVTDSYEKLRALAEAGVNVFRLNFSHGEHVWHRDLVNKIRRLEKELSTHFPIVLDTKGPEIRSGDIDKPIELVPGERIIFSTRDACRQCQAVSDPTNGEIVVGVNYDDFVNDVEVGDTVLVDSGVMSVEVVSKDKTEVVCKIIEGGLLKSRRHINLPGKHVSLEPVTSRDWQDIALGVELGVDFIAQSFVRAASDVELVKEFLHQNKADHIQVIAKIETAEAAADIDNIIEVTDGVMVARGDLGSEIPFKCVPQVQRRIIEAAERHHKPVIVATQMLESMIENPIPTRAEVTDVSMAVYQRADSGMLSGESASGCFPVRSVQTMADIFVETENSLLPTLPIRDIETHENLFALAKSSCQLFEDLDEVKAMVVVTDTGRTARLVSSFRPNCPIFACTDDLTTARQLNLLWGVESFMTKFNAQHPEVTVENAKNDVLSKYSDLAGQKYILVSSALVKNEFVPMVQIREF